MFAFLIIMLGCFVFFGAVFALIYRFTINDSYAYDMEFIWDRYPVTLKQMELGKDGEGRE